MDRTTFDGGSLGRPHIKPLTRVMVRRMEEEEGLCIVVIFSFV